MKIPATVTCGLLAPILFALPLFGRGGEHAIKADGSIVSARQRSDWPTGLVELISSGPVFHGHWVNANDEFFFMGDTASLTRFLTRYSTLKNTPLTLVVHAGATRRSALRGDKPSERYDWKVSVIKRGWGAPEKPEKPEEKWVVTIDVWIDRSIRLADLVVPKNVEVKSAGEIEAFVAKHGKKRGAGGEERAAQPTAPSKAAVAAHEAYVARVRAAKALPDTLSGDANLTHAAYLRAFGAGETTLRPSEGIPQLYWAERIKQLKPIRVYTHGQNVVVVQRHVGKTEEGLYIPTIISSSMPGPGHDDGFVLSQGELGVFKFTRKRQD